MHRLILLEGLPGTGKTTISKYIYGLLRENRIDSLLLDEFDERIPCNFYNVAGIPNGAFEKILSGITVPIESIMKRTENYIYLKIDGFPAEVEKDLRRFDIGDEFNKRLSLCEYIDCTLEWWDYWARDNLAQPTAVLDGAFLQNPINEMVFRGASDGEIIKYVTRIAKMLAPYEPLCVYLRRNSAVESIEFAKSVKGPVWSAGIDDLKDIGHADLFERRFELDHKLLGTTEYLICDVDGNDWKRAKTKINCSTNSHV